MAGEAHVDPAPLLLLLEIKWRDSHFDVDWDGAHDDYLVTTVGYLIAETEHFTYIAQEVLPDGEGFRAVTGIVTQNIESRDVKSPVATATLMTSIQGGNQ